MGSTGNKDGVPERALRGQYKGYSQILLGFCGSTRDLFKVPVPISKYIPWPQRVLMQPEVQAKP